MLHDANLAYLIAGGERQPRPISIDANVSERPHLEPEGLRLSGPGPNAPKRAHTEAVLTM